MTKTLVALASLAACVGAASAASAAAQDYNYVPGWANTYNHQHRSGEGQSELPGESRLLEQLRDRSPAARCAVDAIEQSDRNVLVNSYRRNERRNGEAEALRLAHGMVDEHLGDLRAQGRCR